MPLSNRLRSLFRNLLSRSREDSSLEQELEAYIEMLTDERAGEGHDRDEIRRELLAAMGGKESAKQRVRERRVGASVDAFAADLRFAWRLLRRSPGFSLLVVATLALGIGATTAVYSVVRGVLLRELPYPSPDRLVLVSPTTREGRRLLSPPDYLDLAEASSSFESLAAIQGVATVTISVGGEPLAVRARETTPRLLSVYGLKPHIGRAFAETDRDTVAFERLGDATANLPTGAILLGYEFWRERLGGDPDALGTILEIEDQPYRVLGVTPRGFRALLPGEGDYTSFVDVWILSRMPFDVMPRDAAFLRVLGRLKADVGLEEARSEAALFAGRQRRRFPMHAESGFAMEIVPLREALNAGKATTIWVLFGAVCLLLLTACANLVSLLLTRTLARRHELAVRMALGAGRVRLVRQLVTESLLYALLAAGVGLALGSALVRLFKQYAPLSIPRVSEVGFDERVLAFALATSLLASLAVAVLPAVRFSRARERAMLSSAGRSLAGAGPDPWRHALVVVEIALAVVLFVGTALFLRTVVGLLSVDAGFRAEDVLTAEMSLPSRRYPRYPRANERVRFARRLTERLEDLPGVEAAALALVVPLSRQDAGHTYASEAMAAAARVLPPAKYRPITPGYFTTVRTRIVAGRTFTWDEVEQYRLVCVVDETLADKAWPGETALGKRLRIERWATSGGTIHLEPLWTEVVGVAQSVRSGGLGRADIETVYLPYGLYAVSELSVLVRGAGAPEDRIGEVRAEVRRLDPGLAVFNFRVLRAFVEDSVAPERTSLVVMGAFALAGLLLALVGVYGALSLAVRLRRREFGLRMALGAPAVEVGKMVLAQGARLLALGVGLGLLAALGLARFLASQLYGVRATDPPTYVAVAALVILVGLLASVAPASRAARMDPAKILRDDV